MKVCPIIMSGGFGTRLRPLSTPECPKQFINFIDGKHSMFQNTFKRIRKIFRTEKILICCNKKHIALIEKQIKSINEDNYVILAEERGRNTFASVLAGLQFCKLVSKSDILFVSPSDSYIENDDTFIKIVYDGLLYSFLSKKHVLFGIKPTKVDNKYGYIKTNKCFEKINRHKFYDIDFFIEKPSIENIEKIFKQHECYWNSGHFIFSISELVDDIKKYSPNEFLAFKTKKFFEKKQKDLYITNENFLELPNNQIDRIIIENSKNLVCCKARIKWFDVGSFNVLYTLFKDGKFSIPKEYYHLCNFDNKFLRLMSNL